MMTITIDGIDNDEALQAHVDEKVSATLAQLRVRPTTTRIAFTDENGPKGGIDTRCAFTLKLPRRPPVHVETTAETRRQAFESAFELFERELARKRERARTSRRRPKKYFIAKQLLTSEVGPGSFEQPRSSAR
jgi:putative sigma-54 modulation protein